MEADFPMVDGMAAVRRLRRFEGWLESLKRPDAALPPVLGVKQEEEERGEEGEGRREEREGSAKPPSFVVLVKNGVDCGPEGGEEERGKHSFERRGWRAGADLVVRNFEDVCLTNIRSIVMKAAAAAAAAARDEEEEKKERKEEGEEEEEGLRMDRNGEVVLGVRVMAMMMRRREVEEEEEGQQEEQEEGEEERREDEFEGEIKEEMEEWEGR
eukprot:evm.model.NODE_14849_length_9366_cov_24.792974.1